MKKLLTLNNVSRVHLVNPTDQEIDELVKNHDLHEIIEQDLQESNTQDKIDVYDEHIFCVLHFPKFHTHSSKHYSNEFNFILGKNILISLSKHPTSTIEKIRQGYLDDLKNVEEEDKELVISPYYLLYKVLDALYDKTLYGLGKFNHDLIEIQEKIFGGKYMDRNLLNRLLIKSRNAGYLQNIMDPQAEIVDELNKATIKLYEGDLDVYFEDLEYKVDKIVNQINSLSQHAESLSAKYNTLVTLKTNSIVTVLTIVTVIVWFLTLITGFYGMNIALPGQTFSGIGFVIWGLMLLLTVGLLWAFRRKGRL